MTHRSWHPNPTREHNSRMAAAAIILSRNPQLHDFWGATQDHCAGNDGADIGFWFGELFGRRIEQWLDAYADQTGTDIDTQDAFYIVYRHMASLYPEDVQ